MLLDARSLPRNFAIDCEICIVGGGVAGISLALEFEKAGIATCLIESGGLRFDGRIQKLYDGETVGMPYDLYGSRTRQFGGSSNCWGGWVRPFTPLDFTQRDWVANSDWPIGLKDCAPYYRRANELVQVNQRSFDPALWSQGIGSVHAHLLDLDPRWLETFVSKFSPPTRFGRAYREALRRARHVKVLLHATVTSLDANHDATAVETIHGVAAGCEGFQIRAGDTILAAGGIENARLLLMSDGREPHGLGNRHDVVGRYFMEHARIRHGDFTPSPSCPPLRFYDVRYAYHNAALGWDETPACAYIGLSEAVQRQEELLQCRTYLIAEREGESRKAMEHFATLRKSFRKGEYGEAAFRSLAGTSIGIPALLTSLLYRKLRPAKNARRYVLESVVESVPDRDSRLTLSHMRDGIGLPRVRLDWRVSALERRTHRRMLDIVAGQFGNRGLGRVVQTNGDDAEPIRIVGCNHHMGTTRMHADPRFGVVDSDCTVHGIHNLHVAGSSVFTTGGNDMPTLTIIALALRLADRLKQQRSGASELKRPLRRRRPAPQREPAGVVGMSAARTVGGPPGQGADR